MEEGVGKGGSKESGGTAKKCNEGTSVRERKERRSLGLVRIEVRMGRGLERGGRKKPQKRKRGSKTEERRGRGWG